jgi:hypothetical protein
MNFILCFGAWFLIEERSPPLPPGVEKAKKRWLPKGIWNDVAIYSYVVSHVLVISVLTNIGSRILATHAIAIFGFLEPFFYLTPYTTLKCPELDPTSIAPAVPLILADFLSGMGRVGAGFLADIIGPTNAMALCFFSAVSTLVSNS